MKLYPAVVNRLEAGHDTERADCAILSLANYLGVGWPEVLRAATLVDREHGRTGLTIREIKKVAGVFGIPLVRKRRFDPEEAYGVLVTPDHAAVLREGWVQDRATVWPWEAWLVDQKVEISQCSLLVVKE